MAQSFTLFADAYSFIDGRLDLFLNQTISHVIAKLEDPVRKALVLYVTLYGFAILRGSISEPIMDFAVRSIKLALIYLLATTVAYSNWVTEPLFHVLPNALAQAVAGSTGDNAGAAFDDFFSRVSYLGEEVSKEAKATDLSPLLVSGLVFVVGALAASLGFGIVILAKVALALIIALGPIFVACALFDASRRYFFGWLSQAINYLILFVLIIAMFQLVLALIGDQWGAIESQDAQVGGLIFIALCLLGAVFFLQTPQIAAGIAGGASAGLSDFGNAMGLNRGRSAADAPARQNTAPGANSGSIRSVDAR